MAERLRPAGNRRFVRRRDVSMLARKISRSKWASKPYLKPDAIRADAVTNCLKTTDDRLSLWRCENDQQDVDQVFLALATGSRISKIDTMHIVVLPEKELEEAGLTTENKGGDTAVQDLKSRHVDLVCLDLDKLGTLARMLASRIRNCQVVARTKKQIQTLVREAVSARRVQPDELSPELRNEL